MLHLLYMHENWFPNLILIRFNNDLLIVFLCQQNNNSLSVFGGCDLCYFGRTVNMVFKALKILISDNQPADVTLALQADIILCSELHFRPAIK